MSEAAPTETLCESTITFPKPDEGLTEAPADGVVGSVIDITKEEACEFYYQLSLRMPAHQFACIPHPVHVESDPRLVELYNKVLGKDNRTNEIQVEYHRLCKEDPENLKEHYRWYQEQLKLEPAPLGPVEEALVTVEEERESVERLFSSLSFLRKTSPILEEDGDGDTCFDGEKCGKDGCGCDRDFPAPGEDAERS